MRMVRCGGVDATKEARRRYEDGVRRMVEVGGKGLMLGSWNFDTVYRAVWTAQRRSIDVAVKTNFDISNYNNIFILGSGRR